MTVLNLYVGGNNKSLATAWIVSTVGSKTQFRKGLKKDMNLTSISDSCGEILNSNLPLRYSSNIMYGVVLIYQYRVDSLLNEVNLVNARLKRDMILKRWKENHSDNKISSKSIKQNKTVSSLINNDFMKDDARFDIEYDFCQNDFDDESSSFIVNLDIAFSSIYDIDQSELCSSFDRTIELTLLPKEEGEDYSLDMDFDFDENSQSETQDDLKNANIDKNLSKKRSHEAEALEGDMVLPNGLPINDFSRFTNELSTVLEPSSFFYREKLMVNLNSKLNINQSKRKRIVSDSKGKNLEKTTLALESPSLENSNSLLSFEELVKETVIDLQPILQLAVMKVFGIDSQPVDKIFKFRNRGNFEDTDIEVSRRFFDPNTILNHIDSDINLDLSIPMSLEVNNEESQLTIGSIDDNIRYYYENESDGFSEKTEQTDMSDKMMRLLDYIKIKVAATDPTAKYSLSNSVQFETICPPQEVSREVAVASFRCILQLATNSLIGIEKKGNCDFEISVTSE